ncbi:MAG: hypothetical protein WA666_00555 [Nitrospirota bacterium]
MPCAAKIEGILLRSTLDGLIGRDITTSVAVNLGMVLFLPVAVEMAKPLVKLTIKTGITAIKAVEDLVAEAKSEL